MSFKPMLGSPFAFSPESPSSASLLSLRSVMNKFKLTEIDLSNPEERLYPGTYAEVSLEMDQRPDALTVPAVAVGSDGDGNFVYTINGDRITRLAIKTGLTDNGRIEVTEGLSEETPVVATLKGVPPPRTAVQPSMVHDNS